MKAQILLALLAVSLVASTGYLLLGKKDDVNFQPVYPVPVFKGVDYEVNAISLSHQYYKYYVYSYSKQKSQYVVYYTDPKGYPGNVTTLCMSDQDIMQIDIGADGIFSDKLITSVNQFAC